MTTFDKALAAVLVHEGGYVDHPNDPGGPTDKGVTERVYHAWLAKRGMDIRPVRGIDPSHVSAIYRQQYWDACSCDRLPKGVAYVVFDGAVNSGPTQSAKWLQRALAMDNVDGHIGALTIQMANAHPSKDRLVREICAQRLAFLKRLKTWPVFNRGWTRRVEDVRRRGEAWADDREGPMPVPIPDADKKASRSDARPAPGTGLPDATIGGGVVAGGCAGAIKEAQDALAPIAGTSATLNTVLAVLALAGAAITIGGIAWRFWQARRKAEHDQVMA
jgi:lysozyme family protein